jgi:phage N-6-adenine-methyltransferase
MNKDSVHYSSKSNEWGTPQDLFDQLDKVYQFTLDPCASPHNAKCIKYYTKEEDGLFKDWSGECVFMNPPYGREIGKWIKKAYEESLKGVVVVCLIPARTDTKYYHDYIFPYAEVQFIKGRVKFDNGTGEFNPVPFPSAIVIFGD